MKKIKGKVPKKILRNFEKTFGTKAEKVFMAPGRVNLIGEHIDYNGGNVLPIALKHATYFAFCETDNNHVGIFSRQENELYEAPASAEVNRKDWAAYIMGVAKFIGYKKGFNAYIDSKVPISAGLSSSASLECAAGVAFADAMKIDITDPKEKLKIALIGQKTENDFIGTPTGIMDQSISMLGQKDTALKLDTNALKYEYIPFEIRNDDLKLLVIESNVQHSTSDGKYAKLKDACTKAAKILKVKNLVDAKLSDLSKIKDTDVKKKAKHVITEQIRVNKCCEAMKKKDWETVGKLLTESHVSMRDDFEISTPELDLIVFIANKYGALGSRLTGAGFGGCVIALTHKKNISSILSHLETSFDEKGYLTPKYLIAKSDDGAKKL